MATPHNWLGPVEGVSRCSTASFAGPALASVSFEAPMHVFASLCSDQAPAMDPLTGQRAVHLHLHVHCGHCACTILDSSKPWQHLHGVSSLLGPHITSLTQTVDPVMCTTVKVASHVHMYMSSPHPAHGVRRLCSTHKML